MQTLHILFLKFKMTRAAFILKISIILVVLAKVLECGRFENKIQTSNQLIDVHPTRVFKRHCNFNSISI